MGRDYQQDSDTTVPLVVPPSCSSAQKAGLMIHFRNVVITANLDANS